MRDKIINIDYVVTIKFNDGSSIDIVSNDKNRKNNIKSLKINESLNIQNNNPVGVVSTNTIKIELESIDKSLIPDNSESEYYGLMDNTAVIEISLTDEDGSINFNKFYVSNWDSNISTSNPYSVIIEGVDLLSLIFKNLVPVSELKKNISTTNTLTSVLDELNKNLPDKYKIDYDKKDINFDAFPVLEYNNIEASGMQKWLNILCQSTLTNIYYDRDNKLKTDYCLDDKISDSVSNLHGDDNVISASFEKGGLVSYSGVRAYAILNDIQGNNELVKLTNQIFTPGENRYEDIDLGGKVFKINTVFVKTDKNNPVEIVSVDYGKRNATIVFNNTSDENAVCDIAIYGQTLKETKISVVKKRSDSNELLEVTNYLLPRTYIDKFANGLLSLISIKESALNITGFFNPRIKLGNQVHVKINKLNVEGYYKVIGLEWNIKSTIQCTAKVIKTIGNQRALGVNINKSKNIPIEKGV